MREIKDNTNILSRNLNTDESSERAAERIITYLNNQRKYNYKYNLDHLNFIFKSLGIKVGSFNLLKLEMEFQCWVQCGYMANYVIYRVSQN